MLSPEAKRRAMAEAQRLKISFADFVRQAIAEKLPQYARGADALKRRRQDPVFRLMDRLPPVKRSAADDVVARHDDYLYGSHLESEPG
jgi:hypothetical protein